MQVRVTHMAFHEGRRVRPGDVIDVPETFKAHWFAPVTAGPAQPEPAPRKKGPATLSQLAKTTTAGPLDNLV